MKNLKKFVAGTFLILSGITFLSSCSEESDTNLTTIEASSNEVVRQISSELNIPIANMNLTIMNTSSLGSFQDEAVVYNSLSKHSQYALITIDENHFGKGTYGFIDQEINIEGNSVDFLMVMAISKKHQTNMPSYTRVNKSFNIPVFGADDDEDEEEEEIEIGEICAGVGICVPQDGAGPCPSDCGDELDDINKMTFPIFKWGK